MNGEKQSQKPQAKKKNIMTILAIVVLSSLVLFAGNDPLIDLTTDEILPEEIIPLSAKVELYKFSDLATNKTVNVELWLINIGDETATNISVFARVRNQNGTILFSKIIPLTVMILRANETCSGIYTVSFGNTTAITHTIEVSWTEGRNSYTKTTIPP